MYAVAFDTETKGFEWYGDQLAFLVTWADADGEYWADANDVSAMEAFWVAIRRADVIIGHNLKFDLHQIHHTFAVDILALAEHEGKVLWDTDFMSRVLHPEGQKKNRAGHALKNLGKIYLRADADAEQQHIKELAKSLGFRSIKRAGIYYEIYRAYPDAIIKYALEDARMTYDIWELFMRELEEAPDGTKRTMALEQKVLPILVRAEERGVATDTARVAEFKHQFEQQARELHDALVAELGADAVDGPDDNVECDPDDEDADCYASQREALIESLQKLGVPLYRKTKSGNSLSTSKLALNEFRFDFPIIEKLFEYRRVLRFLSTYIGPMEGREVIHADFQQLEAWTGRMSCRRPNMQNWPKRAGKEVRSVLVPRPGYAFVVGDYEGIEERLGAYYLGDPDYRRIAAERDPHAWMAAQIWGGEPDEYAKGTDKAVSHRQPAKNIKYALWFGAGAPRVKDMMWDAGMRATDAEAKSLARKIKDSTPGYWHLMDRIREKIARVGYINTINGRKNPVEKRKSYVGMSALIQGSAADIIKIAAVRADQPIRDLGGTIIMIVHDELLAEVPIENAERAKLALDDAMLGAWNLNPPLAVESAVVTTNYADA